MGRVAWLAWCGAAGVVAAAACGLDREGLLDTPPGSGGANQGAMGGASVSSGGMTSIGGGPASTVTTVGSGGNLPNGAPCSSETQCESEFCIDGFCCNTDCDKLCEACDVAQLEGECTKVPTGTDPAMECMMGEACDGNGACKSLLGETCMMDGDCLSDECADGFCCDAACDGECEACSAELNGMTDGECLPVPAGDDPDDECPGGANCAGNGMCE